MDENENSTYCETCHAWGPCDVRGEKLTCEIKGETVTYEGKTAYCRACGNKVWLQDAEDENVRLARSAYCEKMGLITPEQIRQIQKKYNIALKPLAALLGWGEITIIRFLNGYIPSRIYSDKLLELLGDESAFSRLLEKNEDKVRFKPSVYNKSGTAACCEKAEDAKIGSMNGDARDDGATASVGLDFEIDQACDGYVVSGIGQCKDSDIVIPSVHNGKKVVGIGEEAFCRCDRIKSVDVPGSVKKIEEQAFAVCSSLKNVRLSYGIEKIGSSAFCYSPISRINLPDSIKEIGINAFGNTSLESIELPNGLRVVECDLFRKCEKLESVTFRGSIVRVCTDAFSGCSKLSEIYYDKGAMDWKKTCICDGNQNLPDIEKIPL